jgi:hypothetical protein
MFAKYLAVVGVFFASLAIETTPMSAQVLTSATATDGCSCGSTRLKIIATGLTVGTSYVINYSITVTPTPGAPIAISSAIDFTATASTETVKATVPLGRFPVATLLLSGTATITSSGSTASISFATNPLTCPTTPPPPPPCTVESSDSANFNGTAIAGGTFIWFNANFTATGVPSTGTTVTFTNSTISFIANGVNHTLAVPDSSIKFSPSATCAVVSFDTVDHRWDITVPVSGSDEIFLSGLAFPVPAAGLPGGIQNVTWTGTFGTNTPGLSFQWKWGAAVYTSFSTAYNSLDIKPTHDNACSYNNSDHAGTPENSTFQGSVVGGARGGGGSNFTGSWSGTVTSTPVCTSQTTRLFLPDNWLDRLR